MFENNGDPGEGDDTDPDDQTGESTDDERYFAHQDRNWNVAALSQYDPNAASTSALVERYVQYIVRTASTPSLGARVPTAPNPCPAVRLVIRDSVSSLNAKATKIATANTYHTCHASRNETRLRGLLYHMRHTTYYQYAGPIPQGCMPRIQRVSPAHHHVSARSVRTLVAKMGSARRY
jgi:hypothetical protein